MKPPPNFPPLPEKASEGISIFDPAARAAMRKNVLLAVAGQVFVIVLIVGAVNVLVGGTIDPNPHALNNLKIAVYNADDPNGIVSQSLQNVISVRPSSPVVFFFHSVCPSSILLLC